MKDGKHPNPNTIHPIAGYDKEIYVKPTITNPNIIVGDFTYIADSDFESHVSHLYEWNDDKLIIGKFCQIAAGVEFVMNGANHQMNAVSTFPFYTLEGWEMLPPAKADMPLKGDTVIENDVWIGQNAVILPSVYIGNGAIIGANSVVGSDVAPYTNVPNPQSVNRAIKRIIADYNATEEVAAKKQHREAVLLPDFSAHHLRHTFCTRLCENETNLKVIQSVMGHKDIQTTMDVYAEATEQKKQESFERLAAKLDIF